ncbi:MAG: hypothetical protein WAY93_05205 [Atopobiaceae bacterium]|jgi:hypothetical protein|nr:hypothetical protein [Atopobiaceae bacterium]
MTQPRNSADEPREPINARSEHYGELQRFVDGLFGQARSVRRVDVLVRAEGDDLDDDLLEIVRLLPPGTYTRAQLTTQINSTLAAHGWGRAYGIVS